MPRTRLRDTDEPILRTGVMGRNKAIFRKRVIEEIK
jgi:hypothetical protein